MFYPNMFMKWVYAHVLDPNMFMKWVYAHVFDPNMFMKWLYAHVFDPNMFMKWVQILTYARHSLSSEGYLTCHTYCDKGLLFINLRGPVTLTPVAERLAVELLLPVFRLRSVGTGDRTPISRTRGKRSTSTPPRRSTDITGID